MKNREVPITYRSNKKLRNVDFLQDNLKHKKNYGYKFYT